MPPFVYLYYGTHTFMCLAYRHTLFLHYETDTRPCSRRFEPSNHLGMDGHITTSINVPPPNGEVRKRTYADTLLQVSPPLKKVLPNQHASRPPTNTNVATSSQIPMTLPRRGNRLFATSPTLPHNQKRVSIVLTPPSDAQPKLLANRVTKQKLLTWDDISTETSPLVTSASDATSLIPTASTASIRSTPSKVPQIKSGRGLPLVDIVDGEEVFDVNKEDAASSAARTRAMEKATHALRESKNTAFRVTHPSSKYSWLMSTVARIVSRTELALHPPRFIFRNTSEAAHANAAILQEHAFDLHDAISSQPNSIVSPDSDFRPAEAVDPLFSQHEYWPYLREIINIGCSYPLDPVDPTSQRTQLLHMIDRGNHQSALAPANAPTLFKNYQKEVDRGWMVPIPKDTVPRLPGAGVIPVDVATQWTIDDDGNRIVKRRTTHDASFRPPGGSSINDRMDRAVLNDCFFGYCLLRLLHAIHVMRLHEPAVPIYIMKLDLEAAYRRMHVTAKMALLAITIVGELAYILLRLPFGVANGPNDYGYVSEPIMDLTNDILRDDSWDPNVIYSPLRDTLATPHQSTDTNSASFGKARPLLVEVPFFPAIADGYIDDIVTVFLGMGDWLQRGQNAALLAVHTLFQPVHESESIPRPNAAATNKLHGEGTPNEQKIVLGWLLNTRRFRIYLPQTKSSDWRREINRIIRLRQVRTKELESLIGRLNHAAHIIPHSRYFLNRIRQVLSRCKQFGPQSLPNSVLKDLALWDRLLDAMSSKGADINNITFTRPTDTIFSDACEIGMGGFSRDGLAWRFLLPDDLIGKFTINLLEFVAVYITIYMVLRNVGRNRRVLAFSDSSSALGWLYRASFHSGQEAHDSVARAFAKLMMKVDSALYLQHIKGRHNVLADMLSRDHHIPDALLTFTFTTLFPRQTPANFKIRAVPPEIVSWLRSLSHSSTRKLESPIQQSKSKLGALHDGSVSSKDWKLKMSSLKDLHRSNAQSLSPRLQAAADEINMGHEISNYSPEKLSRPPSHMFVRPFSRIFGLTRS